MNLKINNTELFNTLKQYSIFQTVIGSNMYKLNDELSDIDNLYILLPNSNIFRNFHQLQFKINHEDHLFVFLDSFILNTLNGDSTINFEVIQSLNLDSVLNWFRDNKTKLFNYSVIKSYLGMAKRDIKYFNKEVGLRNKQRKLIHIYRGLLFAENIFNGLFTVELNKDKKVLKYKTFTSDIEFNNELELLGTEIQYFRNFINFQLDKKLINFYLPVSLQKEISTEYNNIVNSLSSKILPTSIFDTLMEYYYDSNESGIVY